MKAQVIVISSLLSGAFLPFNVSSRADTFGSGTNSFTVDFVTIGNPGNPDDAGAGGGIYSSPYGGVGYIYRMAVTEVPNDWITKATNLGLAHVTQSFSWPSPLQPATSISFVEGAAFVNWLNVSTGHQPAYNLGFDGEFLTIDVWSSAEAWQLDGEDLYRHKDAYYFLPREDEWYKAAYHKNDGVTANYWDYATGSNNLPSSVFSGTLDGTAVYNAYYDATHSKPAAVNDDGGLSPYGTRGQNGNAWELLEANTDPDTVRYPLRGGYFSDLTGDSLRSSSRYGLFGDRVEDSITGIRVASVPEPSIATLMTGTLCLSLLSRRCGSSVRRRIEASFPQRSDKKTAAFFV